MKIDVFTFFAQMINFIGLCFLLYYFLYKKVIKIMNDRQEKMAKEWNDAKRMQEAAANGKKVYEQELDRWQYQKNALMQKMEEEIAQQKSKEIDKIREEVGTLENQWKVEMSSQKMQFFQFLRSQVAQISCVLSRQALQNLSNKKLEEILIDQAIQKFDAMNEEEKRQIRESYSQSFEKKVSITSTFEMNEGEQKRIQESLQKILQAPLQMQYRISPSLILGIEVELAQGKIGWNLEDYLRGMEEKILKAMEIAEQPKSLKT